MSQYNFGLTTFDPSGKLGQLQNSLKAVSNGDTSLGITAKNGVVIATEKKPHSPLVDTDDWNKVFKISSHLGCVYSGIGADARLLVRRARKQCSMYGIHYNENIPVTILSKRLGGVAQDFTQSGGVRPFGVSLLIGGYDSVSGCQLYQIDPSGAWWAWKASAIGKNQQNAKHFLERRWSKNLELEDAIHIALLTLKEGFDGDVTSKNIQVGIVREKKKNKTQNKNKNNKIEYEFVILSEKELQDYLDQVS